MTETPSRKVLYRVGALPPEQGPRPTRLLMLSGGLDSAWCLNHYLSQGIPLRTHHVRLTDHEGRHDVEDAAVERILEWVDQQGWSHLVIHTRSEVDYGTLRYIPFNHHLWAYWAGAIMADPANRQIDTYIVCRHSDAQPNVNMERQVDAGIRAHIRAITGRNVEFEYPMYHLAKADVVRTIPAELRERAWWCRRPVRDSNGGYDRCHKCRTCRQVDAGLAAIGLS